MLGISILFSDTAFKNFLTPIIESRTLARITPYLTIEHVRSLKRCNYQGRILALSPHSRLTR